MSQKPSSPDANNHRAAWVGGAVAGSRHAVRWASIPMKYKTDFPHGSSGMFQKPPTDGS